jgi:hypothetical protein
MLGDLSMIESIGAVFGDFFERFAICRPFDPFSFDCEVTPGRVDLLPGGFIQHELAVD